MEHMNTTTPIDSAGTPRANSLFAIFPDSAAFERAQPELAALGLQPQQLQQHDAAALDSPDAKAGIAGTVGRFVKGMLGGETNMAKQYVQHLQEGRVVLACPVDSQEVAAKATQIITKYGGYEVTYFRTLGIQYMSPAENADHGIPTHSGANTDTDNIK